MNSEYSRFFDIVKDEFRKFPDKEIILPSRATKFSAGYDFHSNETVNILPKESYKFYTDVYAKCLPHEFLQLHIRSSIGIKKELRLANIVGIIDSDYALNETTGGNIIICLINTGDYDVTIEENERIAQGIFCEYLTTFNDNADKKRTGGLGSTH